MESVIISREKFAGLRTPRIRRVKSYTEFTILTHRFESLLSYGTMRHFHVGERRMANGERRRRNRKARSISFDENDDWSLPSTPRAIACFQTGREISRVFNLLVTGNRPATSVPRARWTSEERGTGRAAGRAGPLSFRTRSRSLFSNLNRLRKCPSTARSIRRRHAGVLRKTKWTDADPFPSRVCNRRNSRGKKFAKMLISRSLQSYVRDRKAR